MRPKAHGSEGYLPLDWIWDGMGWEWDEADTYLRYLYTFICTYVRTAKEEEV